MSQDLAAEVRSLALGIRMVLLVLILILFSLNLQLIFLIDFFARVYADIFGGKPLPGLTILVLHGKLACIVLALAIMAGAVGIQFRVQNNRWALVSLSSLILVSFVQLHFTGLGLFAPIPSIINITANFR